MLSVALEKHRRGKGLAVADIRGGMNGLLINVKLRRPVEAFSLRLPASHSEEVLCLTVGKQCKGKRSQ